MFRLKNYIVLLEIRCLVCARSKTDLLKFSVSSHRITWLTPSNSSSCFFICLDCFWLSTASFLFQNLLGHRYSQSILGNGHTGSQLPLYSTCPEHAKHLPPSVQLWSLPLLSQAHRIPLYETCQMSLDLTDNITEHSETCHGLHELPRVRINPLEFRRVYQVNVPREFQVVLLWLFFMSITPVTWKTSNGPGDRFFSLPSQYSAWIFVTHTSVLTPSCWSPTHRHRSSVCTSFMYSSL